MAGRPRRLELDLARERRADGRRPREAGFGTRLIERSLDKVLDSSVELSFPATGADAKISLPIA